MDDLELASGDEYFALDDPSIFFSVKAKPGHEAAVGKLFGRLIDFCDKTGAGWVPTYPHQIPGHPDLVMTIRFNSEEQKQDFLDTPQYQDLRIGLVAHCPKDGITVLK